MAKQNRISVSRPETFLSGRVGDLLSGAEKNGINRVFYFGQVIDSEDPDNANRIRVRIPLIDDAFYYNDSGELTNTEGHDKLPYCIAAHGRYVESPENGSVVLVGLMDPSSPFAGRIWFAASNELSSTDLFDKERLNEEIDSNTAWENVEESIGVNYNNTPGKGNRSSIQSKKKKVNYKVGLRGKDKNKLLFEEGKTTLVQNEGENNDESKIELTEKFISNAKEFEFLANQSNKKHQPVFADPLFTFMQSQLNLLNQIITLLNTSPGTTTYPGSPVSPSPSAPSIQASYQKLTLDFNKLKQKGEGHSKYITIS